MELHSGNAHIAEIEKKRSRLTLNEHDHTSNYSNCVFSFYLIENVLFNSNLQMGCKVMKIYCGMHVVAHKINETPTTLKLEHTVIS